MKKYIFLVLFLLCGCSPVDVEPARQEVNSFHDLYQAGKYTDIYIITSSDFQAATSEKNFINIMNEAKEKHLGTYKKSTLKTERITHSLFSNNEVSLIYFSEYSKRIVQEIFVFELEGKKVKLKSYRYDSIN
ncbi:type IV secretion protein Rhs [Salmonella enterica subsp. salamae]|nr:type IV secretion protein Rhs [Salmonella enterica]EBQ2951195.1 type IV secretion protein Rhs [Salmonella enterica]EEI3458634.1 type IV secretion protein Rhs [Salmonella enterica subsp. salamae]HCM1971313.1 type IV secretion protein Rhs [Salmonella enterica subsp. salamae serovar 52:z:z39]